MGKIDKLQQNSTKTNPDTGLSPIQEQVAILLASGDNITDISEKLSINRSTIYQWQKMIAFKCYFNLQRKEAKETLRNGIFGLYGAALTTLKECLLSGNESNRLKTAMYVIERVVKSPIGSTDIREVLKNEATEDLIQDLTSQTIYMDEAKYERLLKENGLK